MSDVLYILVIAACLVLYGRISKRYEAALDKKLTEFRGKELP